MPSSPSPSPSAAIIASSPLVALDALLAFPRPSACTNLALRTSRSSTAFVLKMAPSVRFFRLKQSRTSPSHSVKLTGGGGFLGSIRTTLESTLGGGLKLFFPTLRRWLHRASSCVLALSRQYSDSPGLATSLMANSRCTMSTAARNAGLCASSLNMSGLDIWYGMFATHRSKYGSSVRRTSPEMSVSLDAYGEAATRLCSSSTMRVSSSMATTRAHVSSSCMVRFPVPGPISRTVSVGLIPDFCMMDCTTSGFFKMCCPFDL
mmetsp:Transcript_328/g.715  ORF Transcript_328/g.715 Transcript_328/m.715 type:complete len:262 (+) Transcript_328:173-958(+)